MPKQPLDDDAPSTHCAFACARPGRSRGRRRPARRQGGIDARIARLNSHVETVRQRESSLRAQITDVTDQIRSLEAQVGDVATQLDSLQQDLSLHQQRLGKLNTLYELRTQKLNFLREQYQASIDRLNQRLVDIYESEEPDVIGVIFSAQDFQSMLDQVDYVKQIGNQDKHIAAQVRRSRNQVQIERLRTRKARASMLSRDTGDRRPHRAESASSRSS